MEVLVGPVAVVVQEGLGVESPGVLGDLHQLGCSSQTGACMGAATMDANMQWCKQAWVQASMGAA